MKSLHNWLIVLLVFIGCSIGLISLYMASLTGVMNKMGLVGGDFRQAVDQNELARQLRGRDDSLDCSGWAVTRKVPQYLFLGGERRVELALVLGGERIICGMRYIHNGNVERGVYTLIKGLYYLKSHYHEMQTLVRSDSSACRLLGEPTYESWVQAYLLSVQGRIYDVVLNVYHQVEMERAGVSELCLD